MNNDRSCSEDLERQTGLESATISLEETSF